MYRLSSPQHSAKFNWQLKPGEYVLGRDPQAQLVVNDSTVSRRHAKIEIVDEKTVRLTDLGSLNGTQVNDRAITGMIEVKAGDTFTFGNVGFILSLGEAPAAKPSSVSLSDAKQMHTSITSLPIEKALAPLPLKDLSSPKIFKAISDMAKMLILPQSVDEMFNQALDLLQEIVSAERVAIFQAKEGSDEVNVVSYRLANRQSSGMFTMSRSIIREVLTNKNAVLFSDLISDERFAKQESIVISGIRSAIAVPLIDENRVLGLLYADTTDPVQRYDEETLKLAATFGNILAAKMTNQSLLKERQEKEALEAELNIASQIQEGLMPKTLPQVKGYTFHAYQSQCKMVGGDLYDVAEMNDGRIMFLLADVSGKGMGAALLASNILSAFRILKDNPSFDPSEATARVSNQLHSSSRSGDFATLFIGLLSPENNTVTYVNAGHNPPLLIRSNGALEHVDPTGIPMGIFGGFSWETKSVTFQQGDRLIVFTDGVPEATDVEGTLFSDERLEKFLLECRSKPLPSMTEALLNEVNKFVGDAPRSDDITLIALERC